jgi:hypothetical protein
VEKKKVIKILFLLVVLSIVISYAHRFLVADNKVGMHPKVITDTVIPAIDTTATKAKM